MRRLEGGLFTLQLIDYILMEVCTGGSSTMKARVHQILNQRNSNVNSIRNIVREYAGNIGDPSDEKSQEKQYLLQLVDKF